MSGLRERKKERTREAIERAALQLFIEHGYDETTIDALCESVLVSRRTFFRYFTSKEDVALSRAREDCALAAGELDRRPATEPYRDSVHAVFASAGAIFAQDPEGHLRHVRLLTTARALAGPYLDLLGGMELAVRRFLAQRTGRDQVDPRVRLAAAAAITAFRVAIEIWRDNAGEADLAALAGEHWDALLTGVDL